MYFLVIVDIATRFCVAKVIRDKRASTIVKGVMTSWVAMFGPPKRTLSDNGGEFNNDEFRAMGDSLGIRVMNTAAEAPFSNGICERLNSVLGRSVKKIREDSGCSIEEALAWAVSARNCLSNFTGFSPNQMVFGSNPCLPNVMKDDLPALEVSDVDIVRRNLNAIHVARNEFLKIESSEKIRRALKHNVRVTDSQFFNMGDHVYYKRDADDKWRGPGVVVGIDGKQIFVKHGGAYIRVHVCRLQRIQQAGEDSVSGNQSQVSENNSSVSENQSRASENKSRANANQSRVSESRTRPVRLDEFDEDTADEGGTDQGSRNGEVNNTSSVRNLPPVQVAESLEAVRPHERVERQEILPDNPDPPNRDVYNLPKFKKGDRFEGREKDNGSYISGKILGRAGKATSTKYKNCFNVQKDTDNSVSWLDFEKDLVEVRNIPEDEETFLAYNSNAIHQAKQDEISNWVKNNVFEEVSFDNQKTISVRWVITEKMKDSKLVVKARLVARGFEEDTTNIRKDSPTCSKESIRILVALSAAMKWKIHSLDIKSAYLQGNRIERDIYLKPPPEFASYNKVWKLKKTVYGLSDAARAWFLRVKNELIRMGIEISIVDPALFSWKFQGRLEGIICVYVDDILWVGSERFGKVISRIKDIFQIGSSEENSFKYIGLDLKSSDRGVSLDQIKYVHSMEQVQISRQRATERSSRLTEKESEKYRSLIGQLNWVSGHTRPDIAFDVCQLSVSYKTARVEDLLRLNKVISYLKGENLQLYFPRLDNIENCYLECYSDAAFGNLPDGGSQGGFVIFLRGNERCPIFWQSRKIKRVVKGILCAETMALVECAETAVYIVRIIQELTGKKLKVHCYVDNKSLFDNLQTDKVEGRRQKVTNRHCRDSGHVRERRFARGQVDRRR